MSDKKLPDGLYQILADGGLALYAIPFIGGINSSLIAVKPFEDKPSYKWLIQNIEGNMYRITNKQIGDHPHPGNKPEEPIHGGYPEFTWDIISSKSDDPSVCHVGIPGSLIGVWTFNPDKRQIFVTPDVGQDLTRFTFVHLWDGVAE